MSNSDELRCLLDAVQSDFGDALCNVSLAAVWPHVERAIVALNDTDPRKRSDAGDALLDHILHAVGDTDRRLAACDAFAGDDDG